MTSHIQKPQSPLERAAAAIASKRIAGYAKDRPEPQRVQQIALLPGSVYELRKRQGVLQSNEFKVGDPNFSWRDKQGSIERNAVKVAESNRIALERIEGRKAMPTATTAPKALKTPANAKKKPPGKPRTLAERVKALSPEARRNLATRLAALRSLESTL